VIRRLSTGLVGPIFCVSYFGCAQPNPQPPPVESPASVGDPSLQGVKSPVLDSSEGPRAVFSRPTQRLIVEFRVHLISAPHETFGDESRLWSIASIALPDAAMNLRSRANGFRAAIGRESDREALMQYLDGVEGIKLRMDQVMPDIDRPVTLEIGIGPVWSSIFYYDRSGKLHGVDLEEAVPRWILRFEMRSANLKEVWVEATPEIEQPPGPAKWARDENGVLREMAQERRQSYSDLTIAAQIPEGGFLVLGLAAEAKDSPVLGRIFFSEQFNEGKGGLEAPRERIYIISPIVRFAENPPGAGSGP